MKAVPKRQSGNRLVVFGIFATSALMLGTGGAHDGGPPRSIVFHSSRDDGISRIYLMNPDGSDQRAVTGGPGDLWPDVSPNGQLIAFRSLRSGNSDIHVLDLKTGDLVNVSDHVADDNWPRWSPNGRRLAFHSNRDGNYNIYTVNFDGSDLHRVTSETVLDQWPDWSPDGGRLAFRRGMDIYVADADGEELNVRRLTFLPGSLDQMPVWSPNGQHIAFMSAREGYPSVFLMSAEGDLPHDPAVNLTPKGPLDAPSAWLSRAPAWSMNGRRIYFMSFRPTTNGDVELFVMNADGGEPTQLTFENGEDGGPQSR